MFRGEILTRQAGNVCASAWMDRKILTVMYTGYDPTAQDSVLRQLKDGSRQSFPCPAACKAYNEHMGGVDVGDQLRGYYHVRMKYRKFYKYVANFLLDTSITNSFVLYRMTHPGTKLTVLKFREVLAKQLIADYCSRRRGGRSSQAVKPLPLQHFPITISPAGRPSKKRGRCSLCIEKKKRTDTMWYCRECSVWLCHTGSPKDCFLQWHRRRENCSQSNV